MRVQFTSDDAAEINELHRWLYGGLKNTPDIKIEARASDSTTMGWDLIDVVLTHSVAVSNLAVAFAAYRAARPRSRSITLTRHDGAKMTIDGPPELIEEAIQRFLTDGDVSDT